MESNFYFVPTTLVYFQVVSGSILWPAKANGEVVGIAQQRMDAPIKALRHTGSFRLRTTAEVDVDCGARQFEYK